MGLGGLRIVGDITYQKMYSWYGLKHHIVEMLPMRTDGRRTTRKDRATQLLICEKLSLAMMMIVIIVKIALYMVDDI